MNSISLYFHIPFCKQACPYCNFFFTTDQRYQEKFFLALTKEIDLKKKYLVNKKIKTIYWGGGTPSCVPTLQLEKIFNKIKKNPFSQDTEITLELNTEDVTYSTLKELKKIGINRFSLGVQSLQESTQPYLKRYTSFEKLTTITKYLQDLNLKNYSFDLIYGIPNLSLKDWEKDLEKVISLQPPHLSLYSLTIEKNTRLEYLIQTKRLAAINQELSREHFLIANKILERNQFIHYEISNWAQNRKSFSQHNLVYWQRKPYLGFGPSAHSYYENKRFFNPPQLKTYIDRLTIQGQLLPIIEKLNLKNRINETIFLSLRTKWGLNLKQFQEEFGSAKEKKLLNKSQFLRNRKLLKFKKKHLFTSLEGKLILDSILKELFD